MNQAILNDLVSCIEDDSINAVKFFKIHPLSKALIRELRDLQKYGYISILDADDESCEFEANQKLLKLKKI